jgi:N-acetylmuramoyl-L-alanine amidase
MPLPQMAVTLLSLALIPPLTGPAGFAKGIQLQAVQCQVQPEGVTVRLTFSQAVDYQEGALKDPDRLFLDFPQVQLGSQVPRFQAVDSDLISAVRAGQNRNDPPVVRVVMDLKQPIQYRLQTARRGRVLLIVLGKAEAPSEEAKPPLPASQVTEITLAQEEGVGRAIIASTGKVAYRDFLLTKPLRLVVDIQNALLQVQDPPAPADDSVLRQVRMSQFSPDTVRIVLDLKAPIRYAIRRRSDPEGLVVEWRSDRPNSPKSEEAARKVVVVDAGHGGKDPGARAVKAGLQEKEVVLDLALRVAELLDQAGFIPLLTRAEDVFVELADRVRFANSRQADLFVSIHCNAMPTGKRGTRCGIEVYYYTPASESLASTVQEALVEATGRPDNGVRRRGFYVIRYTVMPSILVEVGYLDHAVEGELLRTSDFRQTVAQGIVKGIQQYLQGQPAGLGEGGKQP